MSFARLFGDASLWEELAEDVRALVDRTEREPPQATEDDRAAPVHWKALPSPPGSAGSEEQASISPPTSAWVRVGISDEILGILNAYRGMLWLQEFDVWYTVPSTSASERTFSQQWHRDGRENHIPEGVHLFRTWTRKPGWKKPGIHPR